MVLPARNRHWALVHSAGGVWGSRRSNPGHPELPRRGRATDRAWQHVIEHFDGLWRSCPPDFRSHDHLVLPGTYAGADLEQNDKLTNLRITGAGSATVVKGCGIVIEGNTGRVSAWGGV